MSAYQEERYCFLFTCSSKDKTDMDVIKENHKFLWDDEEADTW